MPFFIKSFRPYFGLSTIDINIASYEAFIFGGIEMIVDLFVIQDISTDNSIIIYNIWCRHYPKDI